MGSDQDAGDRSHVGVRIVLGWERHRHGAGCGSGRRGKHLRGRLHRLHELPGRRRLSGSEGRRQPVVQRRVRNEDQCCRHRHSLLDVRGWKFQRRRVWDRHRCGRKRVPRRVDQFREFSDEQPHHLGLLHWRCVPDQADAGRQRAQLLAVFRHGRNGPSERSVRR